MRVRSLSWEDALEEEMATHSSILARIIPWTEKPGGLQSMGLLCAMRACEQVSLKKRQLKVSKTAVKISVKIAITIKMKRSRK